MKHKTNCKYIHIVYLILTQNDVRRKLKVLEKAGENEFVRLNERFGVY